MWTRRCTCLALLALSVGLAGCSEADIEQIRQQIGLAEQQLTKADEAIAALKADKAKVEAEAASLPDGKRKTELLELAAEYGAWIEQSQKWRDQLGRHLASLHTALDAAEDEIDVVEALGKEVGASLPAPFGTFVTMGTLLGVAVWRAIRNGRLARNGQAAVRAVEAAKIAGEGKIDFTSPTTKQMLSATMGKAGEAFVDAVQGKK